MRLLKRDRMAITALFRSTKVLRSGQHSLTVHINLSDSRIPHGTDNIYKYPVYPVYACAQALVKVAAYGGKARLTEN